MISEFSRAKLYQKLKAVGLNGRLVSRAVSLYFTAFCASVAYYVPLSGVGFNGYGLHFAAAFRGSVTRIYVKVKRPKAERAMVSRAVAEGLDLLAAVLADK